MADKIKIGIIGIGNMGSGHFNNILNGACPELEVRAVADIDEKRLDWARKNLENRKAEGEEHEDGGLSPDLVVGGAEAGCRHQGGHLERGRAEARLQAARLLDARQQRDALRTAQPQQRRRQQRRDDEDVEEETELLVMVEYLTAFEDGPDEEGEVAGGEEHEEDGAPLEQRPLPEEGEAGGMGGEAAGGDGRERMADGVERIHAEQPVEDAAERGEGAVDAEDELHGGGEPGGQLAFVGLESGDLGVVEHLALGDLHEREEQEDEEDDADASEPVHGGAPEEETARHGLDDLAVADIHTDVTIHPDSKSRCVGHS